MSTFDIQHMPSENSVRVEVVGHIDEDTNFPDLVVQSGRDIYLDLAKVIYINSIGIRGWLGWMSDIQRNNAASTIFFEKVPLVVSRQIVTFQGMLPKQGVLSSLALPCYCEPCDLEPGPHTIYLPADTVAAIASGKESFAQSCPKCGKPMELDVDAPQIMKLAQRSSDEAGT